MFDARLRLHLFPTPTDADRLCVGAMLSGSPEPWLCGWTHFFYLQPALHQGEDKEDESGGGVGYT